MKSALVLVFALGCASPKAEPMSASSPAAPTSMPAPPVPVAVDRAGCARAFEEGRYELATKCSRALYVQSNDPVHLLAIGRAFELNGDSARAIAAYSEYVAHDGADPVMRDTVVMQIQLLEAKHAVAQSAEILYEHGESLEREGLWEEAASAYQRYLFAKGNTLSYLRRSSLELRIKNLRAKRGGAR